MRKWENEKMSKCVYEHNEKMRTWEIENEKMIKCVYENNVKWENEKMRKWENE